MLRKLLIALGVALGLLVLAVAALLLFVDVNQFKPQIEQAASGALQRRLSIDGDLKLSVFPRLAVRLPKTTLSERGADRTFAELAEARVGVELLPLLRGRINVDRVEVDGLRATIERRKDGTTNIDDLLGKDAAPGKPAAPQSGSGAALPEFEIAGVELRDARVTVLNPDGGVLQLAALSLKTGRLAPRTDTDLAIASDFSLPGDGPKGKVALSSKIEIDLPSGQFIARDLKLDSSGELRPREPYELSISTAQAAFGASTRSEKLLVVAKLAGPRTVNARVEFNGLDGDAKQVAVQSLAVVADAAFGGRKIDARLNAPVQFNNETRTLRVEKLTGAVNVDDPTLPNRMIKISIDGGLTAAVARQQVASALSVKFDETAMTAKIDAVVSNPTRLNFDVQADRLNLDRYLPPPAQVAAPAPARQQSATSAGAPQVAAAGDNIDLSALRGFAATGQLRIGQLQIRGLKTTDVRVATKLAGGRLDLTPLSAQLYGGALAGSAHAAADGNRVGLNVALTGVDLEPLLRDAVDKSLLEGRGTVRLNVAGAGQTVDALRRGLDGTAALALRDGAIKGINIAQKLRAARALASGGLAAATAESGKADAAQKTDFSELNASFTIKDGVATSNDLDAKSPLLRLAGAGQVDVGGGTLDYTLRVSVVGTLKGQDGRDLTALRGVTVPVRLYGPFEQLAYTIDWQGLAQDALKARAIDELQKRLGGSSADGEKKKLEDKARDALKGLFGR